MKAYYFYGEHFLPLKKIGKGLLKGSYLADFWSFYPMDLFTIDSDGIHQVVVEITLG